MIYIMLHTLRNPLQVGSSTVIVKKKRKERKKVGSREV